MNKPIIIVIFLSLTLILGIGLIQPKYQELKVLEQKIKEKKVDIDTKEEYVQNLTKVAEELKNYQTQLAKIDSILPSNPGLEVLLNFLQKASFQSGLVLTDIKPPATRQLVKEEKKESETKETELSFGIGGDYISFKKFLSVLEMNARLIEVESISFSWAEKEKPQNFNLKIKVYSY